MSSDTFVKVDRYNLCDSFLCSLAVIFKTIRRWPTHGSSIASAGVGRAGLCTAGQAEPHKAKAALVAWQGIHWNTQRKAEKWTSFWEAIRSDWHICLARKRSPVTLQPETHIPCWSSGKIKHVALPGVTKGVAKSIFISGKKKIRLIKQSSFCFWFFVFFFPCPVRIALRQVWLSSRLRHTAMENVWSATPCTQVWATAVSQSALYVKRLSSQFSTETSVNKNTFTKWDVKVGFI